MDKIQQQIVEKAALKSIVIAAAGSGKTTVLTERVRFLLESNIPSSNIAVLTFTNLAAEEMASRLTTLSNLPFIGTIHSFANQNLLRNKIDTNKLLDEEKYDDLLALAIQHPSFFQQYEYILWDEVQDSNSLEFEFIIKTINATSYFIVADPRQSIYGFKGSNPSLIMNLTHSSDFTTYYMDNNYRCGYNILKYAKRIIQPTGLIDNSQCKAGTNGVVSELPFDSKIIVNYIQTIDSYSDWAFLTRTNQDLNLMAQIFKKNAIPYVSFKQSEVNKEQLSKLLNQDAVKLLTIHSSKGMGFKNVFVMGTRFHPIEERNVCYVAATRAKDNLFWVTKKKGARF